MQRNIVCEKDIWAIDLFNEILFKAPITCSVTGKCLCGDVFWRGVLFRADCLSSQPHENIKRTENTREKCQELK